MTREEAREWAAQQLRENPEWAMIVENPRFFHCPKDITTAEDAFTALGHYLWRWKKKARYLQGGVSVGQYQQNADLEADRLDRVLAAFVQANPGVLEALLEDPEHQDLLLRAQGGEDAEQRRAEKIFGGHPESLLALFWREGKLEPGEPLWRTASALDPLFLLESWLSAQGRFLPYGSLPQGLIRSLLKAKGPALATQARARMSMHVVPSLLDFIDAIAQCDETWSFCFPDILPAEEELVRLSPSEILATLAHYTGLTPEAFQARLVRGKFIAEGEHVGEVIRRDAETLLTLGISRHRLAKVLQDVQNTKKELLPWRRKLDVNVTRWRGHHREPFHHDDVYGLSSEVGGAADVTVRNRATGERLAFGSMLPYLIRRACFFEGAVPYRLDPAVACRVLEPLRATDRG